MDSTLKQVFAPSLGVPVKLGRTPPRPTDPSKPRLRLGDYLSASLPEPPAKVDYTPAAPVSLSHVYMNDQLGDCVIACGYHILATVKGNAGVAFDATDAQIVADYSAIGGYRPGMPWTDNGCNEGDALDYWTKHGFASGDKILGYATVDASNPKAIRQAAWLFENVFFGCPMPGYWVGGGMPQRSGFTWDVAGPPNPMKGHAFPGLGYTDAGVTIDTWGMLGTVTWAAAAKYAVNAVGGEMYVVLSEAMLIAANRKAPSGLDLATLVADLNAMGASINPVPAPDPVPTPPSS